jgi:hypothetical protein
MNKDWYQIAINDQIFELHKEVYIDVDAFTLILKIFILHKSLNEVPRWTKDAS